MRLYATVAHAGLSERPGTRGPQELQAGGSWACCCWRDPIPRPSQAIKSRRLKTERSTSLEGSWPLSPGRGIRGTSESSYSVFPIDHWAPKASIQMTGGLFLSLLRSS